MREFYVEQFLPCQISEIKETVKTKPLPEHSAPLFLSKDVYVYRMNKDFYVESDCGQFVVGGPEVIRSIDGRTAREICENGGSLEELEQFYHYGLISYDSHTRGRVFYREVPEKYLSRYEGVQTTWFCFTPLKIEIDITRNCNLNCIHCSRDASPSAGQGEMSRDDYVNVIRQAGEMGVSALTLMGGEPTCSPFLMDLASMAKASGIRHLSTSTNGWLVDERTAEKMVNLFKSIQVSIHGAKKETHDAIVGREGAFDRVCNAARLFRRLNVGSLNATFTVMKENAHEISDMMDLARELGISQIRFLVLTPEGRGRRLAQWTDEDKDSLSKTIKELREQHSGCVNVTAGGFPPYCPIVEDASFYGCPAARILLYVSADGLIKPCATMDVVVGRAQELGLMEAWHSEEMVNFRRILPCECPYKIICAGGCLGNDNWLEIFQKQKKGGLYAGQGAGKVNEV